MMDELRAFLGGPAIAWAPRLTALLLIATRPWRQHEPSGSAAYLLGKVYLALLLAALLLNEVASNPLFWFLLTGTHFLWIVSAYEVADNHRYLEGYWCLAIGISLWAGGAEASPCLALNARLLIGLCFFFAVLWKASSGGYRNGSFFVERLLFERRFLPLALWVGGLRPKVQIRHLEARRSLSAGRSDLERVPVPTRLRRTGLVLAWWTLGIEVLIAALFLLPLPGLDTWRALSLGFFVVTSYLLVPVPTFGQILLLMASVTLEDVRLRLIVLVLMLAVGPFAGIAHLLERVAKRRMDRQLRSAPPPQFFWAPRASSRRLTQEGSSWRLQFPAAGLSLYIESSWVPALQELLAAERPLSTESLGDIIIRMPGTEGEELVNTLLRLGILRRISSRHFQ